MSKPRRFCTLALAFVISTVAFATRAAAQDGPPKAQVREVTDTYFGEKVVDPYRWMEDSKSAEVAAWMKAQSDYPRASLDRLPTRQELLKRLSELSEAGVQVTAVQHLGGMYFYYRLSAGGQGPAGCWWGSLYRRGAL